MNPNYLFVMETIAAGLNNAGPKLVNSINSEKGESDAAALVEGVAKAIGADPRAFRDAVVAVARLKSKS